MKKVFCLILFLSLFVFISCEEKGTGMFFKSQSNEEIADITFNEIIDAVKNNDDLKIVEMFSKSIQDEDNLSQDALKLIDFIHGDIISISHSLENGVGTDSETNNGKTRKEIQSSFCIVTTENKYYVAIKECVRDDFDNNNKGVLSIYIIEANNWTENYVYRGDGTWSQGINIVDSRTDNQGTVLGQSGDGSVIDKT